MEKRFYIIVSILLFVFSSIVFSQIKIPLKEQIPVILKALNYNKTIKEKAKKNVNIAILYDGENELSKLTMEEVNKIFKKNDGKKVFKKKIKLIKIPYTSKEKLEKKVFIKKLNAFFVCAGLEEKFPEILEVAKFNKIITISADESDIVNSRVTLGVAKVGSVYKPYISLINAKENNVELDFKLLKIAEVIK